MRLTDFTDYSLRVLIYLAVRPDSRTTIDAITDAYGISRNHLVKVVHRLSQEGLVETARGRGGGLKLAEACATVTIGEIVRRLEPDFKLVECFDSRHNLCVLTDACALQSVLGRALGAWFAVLDGITLADLVRGQHRSALEVRLFPPAKRNAA